MGGDLFRSIDITFKLTKWGIISRKGNIHHVHVLPPNGTLCSAISLRKASNGCEVGTSIGWFELLLLQVLWTKQQFALRASYLVQALEMRDLVGSVDEGHCVFFWVR